MAKEKKNSELKKYVVISPINAHLPVGDPARKEKGDMIELDDIEAGKMAHAIADPNAMPVEAAKADLVEQAKAEAAKIIADAQAQAEKIKADAEEKGKGK